MKNSRVIFIFLTGSILFMGNLFQKPKLLVEAEKNLDLFEYVEFDGNLV